ncbi:transposase, partial [Shigella flexneri]
VTHHAFSSGAGRTSDGNESHASTLKSPSYTKSVSWKHYPLLNSVSKENGQSHKWQIENNDVIFFASLFMVRMSCF